jgi:hypothetical protein
LFGWSKARRFVVVRERIQETKAAVGRLLIDLSIGAGDGHVWSRAASANTAFGDVGLRLLFDLIFIG